jgi:hypothetical protein
VLLLPTACLPSLNWIASPARQWAVSKDQDQKKAQKLCDNNDQNQSHLIHEIAFPFHSRTEF